MLTTYRLFSPYLCTLERLAHHTDWTVLILLIGCVVLIYLRIIFPRKYKALTDSITNTRSLYQFYNPDRSIPFDTFLLLKSILFYLVVPLSIVLCYRFIRRQELQANDWQFYLAVLFFLVTLDQVQRQSAKLLGWIFKRGKEINNQIFIKAFLWHWSALGLIPLTFIALFSPFDPVWIAIILSALLALSYLWAVGRSIQSFRSRSPVSFTYLFYYLCALEILPWLVVVHHLGELWKLTGLKA